MKSVTLARPRVERIIETQRKAAGCNVSSFPLFLFFFFLFFFIRLIRGTNFFYEIKTLLTRFKGNFRSLSRDNSRIYAITPLENSFFSSLAKYLI